MDAVLHLHVCYEHFHYGQIDVKPTTSVWLYISLMISSLLDCKPIQLQSQLNKITYHILHCVITYEIKTIKHIILNCLTFFTMFLFQLC